MTEPIRVVVVDDEALVRGGYTAILAHEPGIEVIGEATNGDRAVGVCLERHPDVVLMDLRMPGTDGITATRRICRGTDSPRVVILTTFDLDEHVYDALRAGASGFLTKDTPPELLADAIRSIARGDTLLSPGVTRRLVALFTRQPAPSAGRPAILDALTAREIDVLRLIARGRTNSEIAGELFLSEATVKTHVTRILAKLALRDRVHAVVLAYECGLVRPGDH